MSLKPFLITLFLLYRTFPPLNSFVSAKRNNEIYGINGKFFRWSDSGQFNISFCQGLKNSFLETWK